MVNELNYDIIKDGDELFPVRLYDLNNYPKQLYVIGNKNLLNQFSLAIVGSRNCLKESAENAYKLSYDLSANGVNIISGFAKGIDKIAHSGAINAGGKTIAVLGGGFNNLSPKENINLFYEILENEGLIITEYPPDMPCLRYNFLSRNRIIAALSYRNNCCASKRKKWFINNGKLWI